jgi:hypothetical protein
MIYQLIFAAPALVLAENSDQAFGKCDTECQNWQAAIKAVENQASKPLPADDLTDFNPPKNSKNLRSLADENNTVLMTTYSKYELHDGVQKYEFWTTLKDELFPRVSEMAADILKKNPAITNENFRIEISNQVNRLLGMQPDANIASKDVLKVWVARVPVLQADVKQVVAKQKTQGFFRPCLDSPSIDSDSCHYTEPKYQWIKDWTVAAWNSTPGDKDAYPFTGEGYTYNWNENQDVVGLQEFVLPANGSDITFVDQGQTVVESICSYCNQSDCHGFKAEDAKRSTPVCGASLKSEAFDIEKNEPSSEEEDNWEEAIAAVANQAVQSLPKDKLREFPASTRQSNRQLRSLAGQETVIMTTWSKYDLYDGVQKYPFWTTLQDEFFPKVGHMAAAILTENPAITNEAFRVEISNQVNRLLGMHPDADVESKDIRKVWVVEVPVVQADIKKVEAEEKTEGFFRPCLESPSITSTSCSYSADPYKWVADWTKAAWNTAPNAKGAYPFTGEGYTYNWNEGQDVLGLQEFVLPANGSSLKFIEQGLTVVDSICSYCENIAQAGDCAQFKELEQSRTTRLCHQDTVVV